MTRYLVTAIHKISNPNGPTTLDARLDDGAAFHRRCRASRDYATAVEKAREMRAYWPGKLRALVVANRGAGRAA